MFTFYCNIETIGGGEELSENTTLSEARSLAEEYFAKYGEDVYLEIVLEKDGEVVYQDDASVSGRILLIAKRRPSLKVGDVLDVYGNQGLNFVCSVTEVVTGDAVKHFEDCIAEYKAKWEGAENPEVEPRISIREYSDGQFFAEDEAEGGLEYQDVAVSKRLARS